MTDSEELQEIREQLEQQAGLLRLSNAEDWDKFEKLLESTISILYDIRTPLHAENGKINVEGRTFAATVLEGLLDIVKGSEQQVEFLTSQEQKVEKQLSK